MPVAPAPVWVLALVGLAGFPVAAVVYAFGPADLRFAAIHVLLTWSAVVLGFLGGIRWSQESVREPPRFLRLAAAMLPPLAGGGLLLARDYLAADWIIGGFIAAYLAAWLFDRAPQTLSRYPALMTLLTFSACVSLALALEKALRI
jgi:hypothetical protein